MLNKDNLLLEEAYLSISKKMTSVPSDAEDITTAPNEIVSSGSVDEPAPGIEVDMIEPESSEVEQEAAPGDSRLSTQDEDEEDDMSLDNLNSIRESVMKIASHCAKGLHLEPWQQQKLAIAMDNLAEVARRIKAT
jgi:hypothetical protein